MRKKVAAGLLAAGMIGAGAGLWLARRPLGLVADIMRAGRATPEALAALQRQRLRALIAYARASSAYYRALYQDLPAGIDDLQALPVVTKPDLMAHFDDWVTDPAVTRAGAEAFAADPALIGRRYLGRYVVWTTSGTTGKPGIFIQDNEALLIYYTLGLVRAATMLDLLTRRNIQRVLRRGSRTALLAADKGHFAGIVEIERLRRRASWLAGGIRLFSVLQPLPALVRELNVFQPSRIGGYPSALMLLADEQRAGRLRIHPAILTPAGEGLAPGEREELERVFGCPTRMGYAASEFLGLGFECGQRWIHINADWVILEPVDAAYQPVPSGQPSHTVLLTNLANRVQPLIRYDLGDSITVRPGPCPCGSPLQAIHVQGRTGDILSLRAPSGASVDILPLAIGAIMEETPGVYRSQIIQTAPDTLVARLETTPEADRAEVWENLSVRLRAYLTAQGAPDITITLAEDPPQQEPTGGKFRQVRNATR